MAFEQQDYQALDKFDLMLSTITKMGVRWSTSLYRLQSLIASALIQQTKTALCATTVRKEGHLKMEKIEEQIQYISR